MTAGPGDAPLDEVAALYAAGALPPAEAHAFEAQLVEGSPAAAELARMDAAVRALAAEAPPVAPPPRLREELLAKVSSDPTAPPGLLFRFNGEGQFHPIPHAPGTYARVLHIDRPRRQFSAILRMDPGSYYPEHHHDGPEECLVLEGELIVGEVRMRAGDYQRAEPGSDHVEQWTDTGAVLYVTAPLSLLAG